VANPVTWFEIVIRDAAHVESSAASCSGGRSTLTTPCRTVSPPTILPPFWPGPRGWEARRSRHNRGAGPWCHVRALFSDPEGQADGLTKARSAQQ